MWFCGNTRLCTESEMNIVFFCLHIKFMIVMAIAELFYKHFLAMVPCCESKYLYVARAIFTLHTHTHSKWVERKNLHVPCGSKYTKTHTHTHTSSAHRIVYCAAECSCFECKCALCTDFSSTLVFDHRMQMYTCTHAHFVYIADSLCIIEV